MWRNENTNFKIGQIIVCILRIEKDIWLLTSVRKIIKDLNTINDIGYESEEVEEYKKFFGRVIIKYHRIEKDIWLLTSVRKIIKDLNTINDIGYESEEVEEYKKFFGRVIIKYHNTSQNMIRKYENIHNELEVNQILKNIFSNNDFLSVRE